MLGNDTDVDGDTPMSGKVGEPATSTDADPSNADGSFSYTPDANYNGPDSFTYKANDGSLSTRTSRR